MKKRTTSVAMTSATEQELASLLVRDDGQEDICLATYRPSTGLTRDSALIAEAVPPGPGDRYVHGNATVTAEYILRGVAIAQRKGCGLVFLHSHPGASNWQFMSVPDRDAESSYANLAREQTGLPLVGMTLATGTLTWSARHWNIGNGRQVDCTHSSSVRVVGDRYVVSWNDVHRPRPPSNRRQLRTVSAWGEQCQADLVRRRILVVGAGSVGLDVVVRLAASGVCHITVMDFDVVQPHNLDRLIGARPRDARLKRPKVHVAQREGLGAATAESPRIEISDLSICEPEGMKLALDHDLVFSCVDRPWPRAVLNVLAYADLIPVIDGGIGIDTLPDGRMRNAIWRSHVIRPMRPCMSCNRQLDPAQVTPDRQGTFEDPKYIADADLSVVPASQNVAPLSVSVAASLFSQYVSFSVAPSGLGDPGPLHYSLNTHHLDHLEQTTLPHCGVEQAIGIGDKRLDLTDRHKEAEHLRQFTRSPNHATRLLRWIDDRNQTLSAWLDRLSK